MTNVAILIPALARPQRVVPLIESIKAAHPLGNAYIVFICNHDDHAQIRAVQDAGVTPLIVPWSAGPGDYARKMNHAYRLVVEADKCEWAFLGADDVRFKPGWFDAALRARLQKNACVVGTNDLGNRRVMRGHHSTHTLVHREYLECGTIDEDDKILCEQYDHNFCDDEFVQTAQRRGTFVHARDSYVEHLHPDWQKGTVDATYEKGKAKFHEDSVLYRERKHLWIR